MSYKTNEEKAEAVKVAQEALVAAKADEKADAEKALADAKAEVVE